MSSNGPAAASASLPGEDELRPRVDPATGIDLSLIEENLKLTPWERIMANDDTVNFADMLRAALEQRAFSILPGE